MCNVCFTVDDQCYSSQEFRMAGRTRSSPPARRIPRRSKLISTSAARNRTRRTSRIVKSSCTSSGWRLRGSSRQQADRGRAGFRRNDVDSSRRRFVGLCLAAPVLARDGTLTSAQRSDASTTWPSVFPALRQSVHGHPLTYLDSAATTLRPQSVIDALVQVLLVGQRQSFARAHTGQSCRGSLGGCPPHGRPLYQRRRCVGDRVRSRHD